MELRFRPAAPGDADALVPLMHESSRALIDTVFCVPGRDPEDFLHRDFLRGRGLFGWQHQYVAVAGDAPASATEDGERIAATITRYPGRRWRSLSLHTLRTALVHFRPRELAGVARRSAATGGLFVPPEWTGIFLANLCVAPHSRRNGVATRLIEHLVQQAAAEGYTAAELDVSEGNTGARSVYEQLGFEVTGCREDHSGLGLDAFQRMRAATPTATRG